MCASTQRRKLCLPSGSHANPPVRCLVLQPSPSFTGITGTATVNKETLSLSNVPPGYYTFVLTADIGRHAGAATTVPTRRVSVLMTLAVFDLKLAFTPPSGLYSGQSFQITYRSWLPADASVFLSIVDTSNTRQWSLTLPSLPGSASDLQRERTVTASVPVTTPTQSLRVVAQAVAHPAYSAGAADITLSLEASTTVLTRTPFSVAATTYVSVTLCVCVCVCVCVWMT